MSVVSAPQFDTVQQARNLTRLLASRRLPIGAEKPLQAAIEQVLTEEGVAFSREHVLGDAEPEFFETGIWDTSTGEHFVQRRQIPGPTKDIVDFLVGAVALEVKVERGAHSIFRQCRRYCGYDQVGALVLATGRAMALPPEINGKPCFVVNLGRAWL